RWLNPRGFTNVFMVLSLILLMGPSWRQQPSPLSQDEAALVILLDVSASMQQSDVQPSRLQRAQQKITDLLALRPDKKAALIVFSGTAHTVLTLTADQDILQQYLAAITPKIMPRSGKFPEYALPLVDEVLRETNAPATIVLFTDGTGASSSEVFKDYFASRPHQLVVVGVGTEEAADGLIPLERGALERLASSSGGSYVELSVKDKDMRRINRRIDSHYVIVEDSALPWLDSGYPLVFPAMALFLMWFRRGWTLTWSWLLLPLLLGIPPAPVQAAEQAAQPASIVDKSVQWFAGLWLTGDQQGRLLMQMEHYRAAARHFEDPMWQGMAHYYAEDFMVAAEYFSRSDTDDALFNEANARAHARDYLRAVHRYDRLLQRSPNYPGAAQNRQRVQELIDEINRLSESQQQEAGVSSEDKELGGDDAIPAEGADEISFEQAEIIQLSAEDILQDPATRDMWLRGVQKDPSQFLAIKFSMQINNRQASGGENSEP
ncbi:MAG: VWA domain-containing protein, partial [Gammaproteobacteria bacterium]|nr:VWA domain-containing protein [Gammaproteobacteria bacterium]